MWRIFEHRKALNVKALRATCLVRTIFSIDINALRANLKAHRTSIVNNNKREWNFARRASISIERNAMTNDFLPVGHLYQ